MYAVGEEEIEAIARLVRGGELFRYHEGGECERFEKRYAEFLGVDHVALAASGTNALTAAIIALGLGPGDEVLVPAHTYMATALAVLAAGAIPVIVDVDESITIDPVAMDDAVGPHTRAVIPVHMWGAICNMNAILEVARKHDLRVIEDACQAVGGSYEGHKVGTIGDIGAFSFNYFKNMTAGEGGAVVSRDAGLIRKARCVIDPCQFYWSGRDDDFKPFASNGTRANEFQGALLNVQLDRIEGIIEALRAEKRQILERVSHLQELGLKFTPRHSPDHECAAKVMLLLPSANAAERFVESFPAVIAGKTGRHNYVEWDQVLTQHGAAHPLMNPYNMEANRGCRREYSKGMCARSLEILHRTVMVATDPSHTADDVDQIVSNIETATLAALDAPAAGATVN
jgi:dTDP-4-amino-4,6-dideoxygalactose transaminase